MPFITPETETRIAEAVEQTTRPRMLVAYDLETRTGVCVYAEFQDGALVAAQWAIAGPMPEERLHPFALGPPRLSLGLSSTQKRH